MRQLVENGFATADEILAWQDETAEDVQKAVAQAQQEPSPDPYRENWTALSTEFPISTNVSVTYIDAIREAQETLLREDERVFLYGQDISSFGGAFKATKGLAEAFPNRVFDCPISEDAMIGLAVGSAIEGMRPIIEMQFADFSSIAFNQIVNQAATHFYRTGMPIPITVRLPSGGTPGSGPFHSQSMEGIYAPVSGLGCRDSCDGPPTPTTCSSIR